MLYQCVKYLTDPYFICSLSLGMALAVLWKRFRHEKSLGLRMAITVYLLSLIIAIPATSFWPLRWIESNYPPLNDDAEGAQAIVVLGGGVSPADSVRKRPQLSLSSSRRCLYGFELYRSLGPLPVYVTGAKPDPGKEGPGEADSMYHLLRELGVKAESLYVEANSSTTHENAAFTSEMLRRAGVHRILLVTEASHMRRSEGCFRKEGIEVVPAVSSYRTTEFHWEIREFLPGVEGLRDMNEAAREWIGYAWYRLTGKL